MPYKCEQCGTNKEVSYGIRMVIRAKNTTLYFCNTCKQDISLERIRRKLEKKLTTVDIRVLLHYFESNDPYPAPMSKREIQSIQMFVDTGLMVIDGEENEFKFKLTEGGNMLVNSLCSVGFPVKEWAIPRKED